MPNYHVVFFESCLWRIDNNICVTIYGNFAKPLDNHYQIMCWLKRFFKRKRRILVELPIISSLAKLDHVCLMKYISHLGYI